MGVRSVVIGTWLKANSHLWEWWPEWVYHEMPLVGRVRLCRLCRVPRSLVVRMRAYSLSLSSLPRLHLAFVCLWTQEEDLQQLDMHADSLPSLKLSEVLDWTNANFTPFRDQGQGWPSADNRRTTSC